MPLVDTHGGVAGGVSTPVALAALLEELHWTELYDIMRLILNQLISSVHQLALRQHPATGDKAY